MAARELIHKACLQQLKDEQISTPACQNLKSLHRGFNSVPSGVPSRWSQQRIALSGLRPWKQLQLWEWWAECIFQRQRRGEVPLIAWVNQGPCPFNDLLHNLHPLLFFFFLKPTFYYSMLYFVSENSCSTRVGTFSVGPLTKTLSTLLLLSKYLWNVWIKWTVSCEVAQTI